MVFSTLLHTGNDTITRHYFTNHIARLVRALVIVQYLVLHFKAKYFILYAQKESHHILWQPSVRMVTGFPFLIHIFLWINNFYIRTMDSSFLYHYDSFSMAVLIRATDSSLPRTSISSVAPPGVICFPDTAVRIGHIT